MSTPLVPRLVRDLGRNKYIYLMTIPAIVYFLTFSYAPMYGAIIAFKDFNPMQGILGSPWVGFDNFQELFRSASFWHIFGNTLYISLVSIVFAFPAPIILALLLNEVRHTGLKRSIQTLTYVPHFISLVVICGLIVAFTDRNGPINHLIALFGWDRIPFMMKPEWFVPIYVSTNIWQEIGWGSIIYIAALSSIDQEQYEAARIDGAGRFQQLLHITLPGIQATMVIMLILKVGAIMNVGWEKIILLYTPMTYDTADVISTYVYRKGILEASYSFSAAVGLFNSVINFFMVIMANKFAKKMNDTGLW